MDFQVIFSISSYFVLMNILSLSHIHEFCVSVYAG